jgi:hypothetical protein
MIAEEPFDPLVSFAAIERLVSRIYFRFSHLFLGQPELRDFWWEMAKEEEQHACILQACRAVIENLPDRSLDPSITSDKAQQLNLKLTSFLAQGTAALTLEEAFRIAVDIESSEIDAIYSKLIHLGGEEIAKTMENLGVPASIQRQKLKAALRRHCADPELLSAAARL